MTSKPTLFYVVRHGQSEWNQRGIIQGQQDPDLSEAGKQQARAVAEELQYLKFDAVFSSDLMRAKKTAEIIAQQFNLPVSTTPMIRERSYGPLEGLPKAEIFKTYADKLNQQMRLNREQKLHDRLAEGVETDQELVDRFSRFIQGVVQDYPGSRILVVCHGAVMRSVLYWLGYAPHQNLPAGSVGNGAYFVLRSDGEHYQIFDTVRINLMPQGLAEAMTEI